MAELLVKLEQQFSDIRSDQIAYKLVIENQSAKPLRLHSIVPRLPFGVQLIEIMNSSLAKANARKAELLGELNQLLFDVLTATSEDFRKLAAARGQETIREMFSVSGFLRVYYDIFMRGFGGADNPTSRIMDVIRFKITTPKDAEVAHTNWILGLTEHQEIKRVFEAKIGQLKEIHDNMSDEDQQGLTTVEPRSVFSATYVIRFKRRLLESAKYHLAFDISHSTEDTPPVATSVSENVQISPLPSSLSVVAVFASLLGVLLKLSLSGKPDVGSQFIALAKSFDLLVAPIVALIFFNVYEHTALGRDVKMPISWRSALLIGALCGLAQDRILLALKAFIGAS